MTLSPGQGLPEHAHRHQGTVSPPSAHLLPSGLSSRQRAKAVGFTGHRSPCGDKRGIHCSNTCSFFFRYTKLWSKSDSNCSWLFSHRRTLLCCWIWQEDNSLSQSQKDSSYFSWCQLRSTFILALIVARLKRHEEDTNKIAKEYN